MNLFGWLYDLLSGKSRETARKRQVAAAVRADPDLGAAAVRHLLKNPVADSYTATTLEHGTLLFRRGDLPDVARLCNSPRSYTGASHVKGYGEKVLSGAFAGSALYGSSFGWSSDRLKQIQHYRHWTFIAVRAVASEVARTPPQAAHVKPAKDLQTVHKSYLRQKRYEKSLHAIQPHEEVDMLEWDHPLCRLFRAPNAWDMSICDVLYETVLFLELTGNAYWWLPPNRAGYPMEMFCLPSHWVRPHWGSRGLEYYEVWPFVGGGAQPLRFPIEQIVHVPYKGPTHKIDGYAPQQAVSEWIDVAESVDRSRFWTFRNGCFPSGVIEMGKEYADLDDVQLDLVASKVMARYGGEWNTGRPVILPPDAKWNPMTFTPQECAYLESAEQMMSWVLAAYGVPKEIIGMQPSGSELSWYAPQHQFCRFKIAPLYSLLAGRLTHVGSRWDSDLRCWWEDPTPQNPVQANRDLETDFKMGTVTPNEARAIRGREAYKLGGNNPLLPQALSPMPLNEEEKTADLTPEQEARFGDQQGNPAVEEPAQEAEPENPFDSVHAPQVEGGPGTNGTLDKAAVARSAAIKDSEWVRLWKRL